MDWFYIIVYILLGLGVLLWLVIGLVVYCYRACPDADAPQLRENDNDT